jgi:Fe-S cluster assembly iron-binding protein IscA
MITLLITIVLFALSLFAAPYLIEGAELQVSVVKGALVGVNYDQTVYEEENETDYTLQVGLIFVLFTLTWTR